MKNLKYLADGVVATIERTENQCLFNSAKTIKSKTMQVKLKSIDIIDSENKFLELIITRIKDEIDTNPLVFGFDIEFETEDKELFLYLTGTVYTHGFYEEETNSFVVKSRSLEDFEINAIYEGVDVNFEVINDGRIQDVENYIINRIKE
jgi:hypothetical protein